MSQQDPKQGPWYDYDVFASMTGFDDGLSDIEEKGEIKWTNTATDMGTGGVHGLRYKVETDNKKELQIFIQHWVHWPGDVVPPSEEKKRNPKLLAFQTEIRQGPDGRRQIRPLSATWMGKEYTEQEDLTKLMHFMQATSEEIRDNIAVNTAKTPPFDRGSFSELQRRVRQTKRRDEIPNLYHLAQRCDFKQKFTLEGMYFNGEFNFAQAGAGTKPPVYPLQLLRAMLGVEADIFEKDGKAFSRSYSVPASDGKGYEGATYSFDPKGLHMTCTIWDTDADGKRHETELYSLSFDQDKNDPNMFALANLEMLGHKPDVTNHKGVARAIRAMKYIHLAIQRGEAPQFSDIIHEHDLKAFLSRPDAPVNGPENPRTMVQVFGANTDAALTEKEKSIGSNGMIMIRDFMKDGKWVKQGIGADWGVTFGDGKNDHYHTVTHNYGRFTRHPAAPYIEPYVDTIINLETHEHEDHLRGVARLAKFGFTLPPLVVNSHTKRVLSRMMSEEGVPAEKIKEVVDRCHVITVDRYEKPENETETFEYGDTVIEQGYETIRSAEEGRDKYFPVLTVYTKQHPEAKTTVRVGPAGHSARALMFEVAGVLYTGDYKMDQTIPKHLRTDKDWLAKCKETAHVHIQESTNAAKADPTNAPIAEVKANRKKILSDSTNSRIFYDTIGSNAIDIETLCHAAGEVRVETMENGGMDAESAPFQYIIFAGTAVRNKYSDMNSTEGFKKEMSEKYGIETLHADSKTAKELFEAGKGAAGRYIVVMTGSQDEPLSLTHRVSRDLHDDIRLEAGDTVIRGQAPIPVGNNYAIRQEQNNRYRYDFGCTVYDAAELARDGFNIYTSSHASQEDYKTVHELTGGLFKLLHHGGPHQLIKMKEHMDKMGAESVIPDKQALYLVDDKAKSVKVIGETPEERVGYREIRDDMDEFYKKHRQQATVIRVKDRWHGDIAERMYRFEQAVADHEDAKYANAMTSRGANIAEHFNNVAAGVDFPPIGIMHPEIRRPYEQNHKNIKVFIGMDSETTGVNPLVDVHTDSSFVASTPDGKHIKSKSLRHALSRYQMPTAGALIVTQNGKPENLYKGMNLRRYVYELYKTYREWPQELMNDKDARALNYGYRNVVFDDPLTMRMMGMALAAKDMKPMGTHGNLQLDVYNLYTAMIAFAPDKVGFTRDKKGNLHRRLKDACLSDGLEYDEEKAHGSLYDTERTAELLFQLKERDPDIFEQMLMNCDFSASRRSPMVDHILGQDIHLNDNAPVFGYVDMRDRTATPKLGALVTIDTVVSKATDAIVVDIAKADIHQLEQLSDEKLKELMDDPNGPFSIIKLNKSPCWFPPQFVFRDPKVKAKAVGQMPKTTLQARANALKKMRSGSSTEVGNNLIQRVQRLYGESKLKRSAKYDETGKSPSAHFDRPAKTFRTPNERIFSLFHVIKPVNQIKNRHYKKAYQLLRDIQPSEEEFKRGFHKEAFWKDAVYRARQLSEETGGRDRYIEDIRFMIEWQVDDINPQWLPTEDRRRINALKSSMLHGPANSVTNTVEKFRDEIEQIESDKTQFERLVGDDKDAKARWETMKKTYLGFAKGMEDNKRFAMSEKKRENLREQRRSSNGGLGKFDM